MTTEDHLSIHSGNKHIASGIAAGFKFDVPPANVTLAVEPIDRIEAAESKTRKYLRLRSADYVCYTSVFLVVDGKRHEITMDTLPSE